MCRTRSSGRDELRWHLERGLGRGLDLLRKAPESAARAAATHVCMHETRWDPEREDRGHYHMKALAIAADPEIESQVLDRWERNIPLQFRGPWSDVGLILAGLGRPRAVELATLECESEVLEEGPGLPAYPEGMSDVREWLAAIREDARLKVGGGLRVGRMARDGDLQAMVDALEDNSCPHLQESMAVAFTRARDDAARDWLLERIQEDRKSERSYWWWQGLSGQRPSEPARELVLRILDTAEAYLLPWVLLTLFRNDCPGDEAIHVRAVERCLAEGAEDAVSVALEWMEHRWRPDYHNLILGILRRSAYGRNRATALELARTAGVEVPEADLVLLLEDAELDCRTLALEMIPPDVVSKRLLELGATEGEDPAFLSAVSKVFSVE
jgi:hypothetical protein